ncbi:hypothetical protein [Clostridium sp.]|uniref:hypothetical protein n=1 Tax=Clostridium sp. TaxID=1506 RepID=UPI001A617FB5|nr:hypothetical protein [Clostridium sp.]MBK5241680.1 hypothetical protein [Clostridium sp.]
MVKKYIKEPNTLKKSDILKKMSLSGKDYWEFIEVENGVELDKIVEHKVGDSFLREDFTYEDICNEFRFIKTGNLSPNKMLVDFTSTQYCKPNGEIALEDGDILIAKDGGGNGLADTSIYFKLDDSIIADYFCGEVLRIRVKESYNKWYIFAILKSQYFKEFLDGVTPGGSTLRHSKLLALDILIPYSEDKKDEIEYIATLMQNLVDKEIQMNNKINLIDKRITDELDISNNKIIANRYAKISEMKAAKRVDTGIFSDEYKTLESNVKSYKHGYYHINSQNISPGRTPDDYRYTDKKINNTFLWITPKNINTLELIYRTYISTKSTSKIGTTDIILSGIRYLGYGYYDDGEEVIFSNQNTLVITNDSKDEKEQMFLLAFLTSSTGKKMQMAWRVDGMVPILYKEGMSNIPIPNFNSELREELVKIYYNKVCSINNLTQENYYSKSVERNKELGIYQLNNEILKLKEFIENKVEKMIFGTEVEKNYEVM